MNAHNPAPIMIEDELERNIALLKSHGEAIQRLKALESELAALDASERHEFQKYAEGYSNTMPAARDGERQRLTTSIAEARPLARNAELSIEPLTAVQREIRARLEASKAVEVKSIVQSLCDDDLADGETISQLAEYIVDLLARRAGLRQFLSDQGRSLLQRGAHAHGTSVLKMVEQIGVALARYRARNGNFVLVLHRCHAAFRLRPRARTRVSRSSMTRWYRRSSWDLFLSWSRASALMGLRRPAVSGA